MDNKEIVEQWIGRAEKLLLGRKIIRIEYMSEDEIKDAGWDSRPICLQLDDKSWLVPQRDDEGNDGGALYYSHPEGPDESEVLPVI